MGNPKKTYLEQHTKQKVAIYDAYLKRYLKIVPKVYSKISIYDPCAGKGKYGNSHGSAVVACENILKHNEYAPRNGFHIYLNEPDEKNRKELVNTCSYSFVKCISDKNAESFISMCCKQNQSGHKLWFIDPYGYTQVKKTSISKIMDINHTEVLLFIPLTFIYRFLKDPNIDQNIQSVANFLNDYSIAEDEAKSCSSAPELANLISKKLQDLYGYSWHATMQEGPLYYSLVFIGKHHYGLDKFLEARDRILHDKTTTQLSLIPMKEERDLLFLIRSRGKINNCDMYILGLKNGHTPSGIREGLINLEARELIHVKANDGVKRRKSIFYIGKDYFEKQDVRIEITALQEQGSLI